MILRNSATIQHQHVLGNTHVTLGIQENQLGDIIVGEDIQFRLTKQLESYIISELTRIKEPQLNLIHCTVEYATIRRELESSYNNS